MTNTSPLSVSEAVRFAAGAVSSLPTMVVTGEVSGFRPKCTFWSLLFSN